MDETQSPRTPPTTEPHLAKVASLMGDPARANMLSALMDGRALTAAELAAAAGVAASTASAHLGKLAEGALIAQEKQGRHRYYRLADADVARALEALDVLAARAAPRPVRTGPKDRGKRQLRSCYDHLAGAEAVRLIDHLITIEALREEEEAFSLTPKGEALFTDLGLDLAAERGRRRAFAPRCLDWSERRAHLGGALGAALMTKLEAIGWVERGPEPRAAAFTPAGAAGLEAWCGFTCAPKAGA
ncbi:MAG: helix-turn-helix transcriptional regulator [Pseudomonadota bacterium]